jgi:hypothetical protein
MSPVLRALTLFLNLARAQSLKSFQTTVTTRSTTVASSGSLPTTLPQLQGGDGEKLLATAPPIYHQSYLHLRRACRRQTFRRRANFTLADITSNPQLCSRLDRRSRRRFLDDNGMQQQRGSSSSYTWHSTIISRLLLSHLLPHHLRELWTSYSTLSSSLDIALLIIAVALTFITISLTLFTGVLMVIECTRFCRRRRTLADDHHHQLHVPHHRTYTSGRL